MNMIALQSRRAARQPVEMMARFRHGISTVTVMLKDITPHGVRIEGVGALDPDEAVYLLLPGLTQKLAFVAWSDGHAAGLEFANPLPAATFDALVAAFGRSDGAMRFAA